MTKGIPVLHQMHRAGWHNCKYIREIPGPVAACPNKALVVLFSLSRRTDGQYLQLSYDRTFPLPELGYASLMIAFPPYDTCILKVVH